MTFKKLSKKQKQIFRWCYKDSYKAIICDGAVRSGKTVCMAASFILWAMRKFNNANFAICGKTVQSAERNIITPLQDISDITHYFRVTYTRSVKMLTVEGMGKKNNFYVFGGKDESSYTLIQGITLSGIFFDEVALMPKSFVEQGIARTISVADARYWFNCNPESQFHWFYQEWVEHPEQKNALRLHFQLEDNPMLTPEQIENTKSLFAGVFYKRYIEGRWVSAEGAIYREFADNSERFILDKLPDDIIFATIGFDFGGNGSAHASALIGITKGFRSVVILDEYYRKEVISPETLFDDVGNFIIKSKQSFPVADIRCDSAETTLIKGLKTGLPKRNAYINVRNAIKGEITDRIRFVTMMMSQGRFFVMKHCRKTIEALEAAVWDSKNPTKDIRLDDGNYNIDSLDAMEYALEPHMKDLIRTGGLKQ